MPHPPTVIKPHEPVAERVLLPGDPGRALRLAQLLLDAPRMLNHHRGLWGYSGTAADGEPLTVQSSGLGGPSAAAVVRELAALGARRLVRVGTASGLAVGLGALVVAESVLALDGVSRALGAAPPDPGLTAALAGDARGLVASADIHDPVLARAWAEEGALAADLTSGAVLAAAATCGVAAAALLGVTRAGGERLADETALEARLGAAAYAALAAPASTSHAGAPGRPA